MSEENEEQKKPSFNLDPYAHFKKPEYHVKMTTGARKILDEEQAKMLINMISQEFEKRPELNLFKFEKVGLVVIKHGFNLTIMTEQERINHSKNA